jgi:hypothetical protein
MVISVLKRNDLIYEENDHMGPKRYGITSPLYLSPFEYMGSTLEA